MLESQTDFAVRIGVSRQCVASYIKRKKLTGAALVEMNGTVMVDVEMGQRQLGARLSADQRLANGKAHLGTKRARRVTAEPTDLSIDDNGPDIFAPLAAYENRAHAGVATMALFMVHEVGTAAANVALDAGASLETAFTIHRLMPVAMAYLAEDIMARLGIDTSPMGYDVDALARYDWQAAAAKLGVPYDPEALSAWADQRSHEANANRS